MNLPDWARAHGGPLFTAAIRTSPEDFQVVEKLGWELSGDGEHDYLWIEKTGANTEWVSRQLARHADVPAKDVGYAGLKDRHAVTRQWFSVPRWNSPDWSALEVEGVEVLDVQRHAKKLRRGAHRGNEFVIALRAAGLAQHADAIEHRVRVIREQGVPNYFGEQRFGRDGTNLRLADQWAAGRRLKRHSRGLAISTVRSFLFNEYLEARVRDGTWHRLLPGDKASLDGSASVFDVDTVDTDLARRCGEMDIHPAGELVGGDSVHDGKDTWIAALAKAQVAPAWRSLRLKVINVSATVSDETVKLAFSLGRGSFATSVLREIACYRPSLFSPRRT
ncbi:MAG: tRNA pseudouridine(13) synthase TruD [Gammaproteobacteria bacterium]|nr:tRNA pseudouridine(13) synthase TruD [Gammaproteobacteria bacterium]